MNIAKLRMYRLAGAAATALALADCNTGDKKGEANEQLDTANVANNPQGTGDVAASMAKVQQVAMRSFNGDRQAAVAGRQAFLKYNCYGCHGGLAGGAMGPSLRDDEWKYGGTDSAIVLTLHQGRPGGMPAWKGVASEQEIKNMVTYIRSMRSSQEPTWFFSPTDTPTKAAFLAQNGQ